ncbi:putative integral membrane protein [Cryptosporidium felis]|nr:putative integral membrane protein [Cryptosporidium felis]
MDNVRHRIRYGLLNDELPLLFFRNALSFGSKVSELSIPLELHYPDASTTLGLHSTYSFNVYNNFLRDADAEDVFDKPAVIVSSEPNDFNSISMDIYNWGTVYGICVLILFIHVLLLLIDNSDFVSVNSNRDANYKGIVYLSCLLLTFTPLFAVANRCPFLMMFYKALFPPMLITILILFSNQLWDLFFISLFFLTRISVSIIQYKMVSLC